MIEPDDDGPDTYDLPFIVVVVVLAFAAAASLNVWLWYSTQG